MGTATRTAMWAVTLNIVANLLSVPLKDHFGVIGDALTWSGLKYVVFAGLLAIAVGFEFFLRDRGASTPSWFQKVRGKSGKEEPSSEKGEHFEPNTVYGRLASVRLEYVAIEEPFVDFDILMMNAADITFEVMTIKGKAAISENTCLQQATIESGARLSPGRNTLSIRQPISKPLASRVEADLKPMDGKVECNLGGFTLGLKSEKTGLHYTSNPLLDDHFYIRGPLDFSTDLEDIHKQTFLFPVTVGPVKAYTPDGRYKSVS